jgi:hypothetical protein
MSLTTTTSPCAQFLVLLALLNFAVNSSAFPLSFHSPSCTVSLGGVLTRRDFIAAEVLVVPIMTSAVFPSPANAESRFLETPEFRGMDSGDENSNLPDFIELPSGVRLFDIELGKGEVVADGKSVSFQWVLRDSRGYFIDSSMVQKQSFIYKVGDLKAVIPGFDAGIRGMRAGGRRRFTVPAKYGYRAVGDGQPGPMPLGFGPRRQIENKKDHETWTFEVLLTKVL